VTATGLDRRSALALVYTAVVLTFLEYVWLPYRIEARLQGLPPEYGPPPSLEAGLQWAAATFTAFLIVPLVIVVAVHRERPSSIGWRFGGLGKHILVYVALYLVMVPAILFAAQRADFLNVYPFVADARRDLNTFLWWELGYLTQFFALEAFFRGYLLFTLERAMGKLAIFVMVVPYCMVHYHKPMLEAYGAVIAGVFLGYLALRYRSWYGGAILHCLVAATMDSLAAHRAGVFD
jgi:membrane protease YdiL (CAAX protease family)